MSYTEGGFNPYSTIDAEKIDNFIIERENTTIIRVTKTKGKKVSKKGILASDKKEKNKIIPM